ncbi:MAG: hypothetical protein IPM14_12545 [bacterium]|nr:hypothetical protein [bacterium]
MNIKVILFLTILIFSAKHFCQTDSIEVYLIDAYCTRELPYTFKLSFYTSDVCKSKVILEDEYEFVVSNELTDMHKADIDISNLSFEDQLINFIIISETEDSRIYQSEKFDFDLPYEPQIKEGSDLFTLCLFGSAIFLLPYPGYVYDGESSYFSLTKEIPVLSFRSKSLNYPAGYLSLEYTYVFNAEDPSYLRTGYKRLFEVSTIEYISPGISFYSNFNINQGISPEISLGLFTIEETFTFYARYRYNFALHNSGTNFQEFYIGLYSAFFSFYPD